MFVKLNFFHFYLPSQSAINNGKLNYNFFSGEKKVEWNTISFTYLDKFLVWSSIETPTCISTFFVQHLPDLASTLNSINLCNLPVAYILALLAVATVSPALAQATYWLASSYPSSQNFDKLNIFQDEPWFCRYVQFPQLHTNSILAIPKIGFSLWIAPDVVMTNACWATIQSCIFLKDCVATIHDHDSVGASDVKGEVAVQLNSMGSKISCHAGILGKTWRRDDQGLSHWIDRSDHVGWMIHWEHPTRVFLHYIELYTRGHRNLVRC